MKKESELLLEIEITKLVGVLAVAFPHAQMSLDSINLYVRMLKDIPLEVLDLAVQQCIVESEFLPTIAKVRDQALNLCSDPTHTFSPLEAWGVVKEAIRKVGSYRLPQFEDPIIAKAVDCIGWRELCLSENQIADRAHFSKIYEQLINRQREDAKWLPAVRKFRELKAAEQRRSEIRLIKTATMRP
jgi:hypothetical protein